VRFNWKFFRVAIIPLFLLLGAGCGGINAGSSVSPLMFFLPGIGKTEPLRPIPTFPLPSQEVAQNQ